MLGWLAAYKGQLYNTGDCSQKALQKYSRPCTLSIYEYAKKKLWTPFLRKLRGRRSVKFGVIVYIEECRMLIFFKIMLKITIINHK